ncbi:hypothetical protein BH743_11620 [Enterococcus faecium]|nr:hypothetical protein BH743_11620 [Enterococcus faecium]
MFQLMKWYWVTAIQGGLYAILLWFFLHNDFDFSVHRLVVGSLFYLCMIGIINYTIYKRNTHP